MTWTYVRRKPWPINATLSSVCVNDYTSIKTITVQCYIWPGLHRILYAKLLSSLDIVF